MTTELHPSDQLSETPTASKSTTLNRRNALKAGAGAIGIGLVGLKTLEVNAQNATATASEATPTTCILAPELTEGPYFLEGALIRKDITEGKAGLPLKL
jgi:hypothetical protein